MVDKVKYEAIDRGSESLNQLLVDGKGVYESLNKFTDETSFHDGSVHQLAVENFMDALSDYNMRALRAYNDHINSGEEREPKSDQANEPEANQSNAAKESKSKDGLQQDLKDFLEDQKYGGVPKTGLTLREVIAKWVHYKIDIQGDWSASSAKRNKPVLEKFEILLDNCEARLVTPEVLRDKFLGQRYQLPKALKKRKTLHDGKREVIDHMGKPVIGSNGKPMMTEQFIPSEQIVEQAENNDWDTDDSNTIARENGTIKAFLDWAIDQKHMQQGLDRVLSDYTKYSRNSTRTIFTTDELKLLFESEDYQSGQLQSEPFSYWVPLICLATGARSGEAAQLRIADIACQTADNGENIWVMRLIADEDTTQTSKSGSSRRVVPIPKVLLDLNFLGFVEQIKSSGAEHLFPELEPEKDGGGWSSGVSSWFHSAKRQVGYMERCGVEKTVKVDGIKKSRVFHSLRHTWITSAKNAGINKEMRSEISGHSQGATKDAHDGYSHDYHLELRRDAINQVNLDIDWLKIAKWQ